MFNFRLGLTMLLTSLNMFNFETNEYKDMSLNPIILDVDMCTDVDDVVAVRIATILDSMQACSLKAVCLSTTDNTEEDRNVKAVKGLLTYDGYNDVRVGKSSMEVPDTSPYWDILSTYCPAEYKAEDAIQVYKDILYSSGYKVTIVTTGYLTNIELLLKDPEGYELVRDKCERIVIQGGSYPDGCDNNFFVVPQAIEAIRYVNDNSPVDLVYVANDVANGFTAGGIIQKFDKDDPVSKSLIAYGVDNGRAAWDPYAVLIAALPIEYTNMTYENVNVIIGDNGYNKFEVSQEPTGKIVIRRKPNISLKQYQDAVEGILGYEYLRKEVPTNES